MTARGTYVRMVATPSDRVQSPREPACDYGRRTGAEPSVERDEVRFTVHEDGEGVSGRAAALGRAPRVHEPDAPVPSDLGQVRVAVGDDVAAREPLDQPVVAPLRGAGIVDEPDPQALRLHDRTLGQRRLEL